MKQLFTLLLTLVATTALWAYDFQYGDLYYDITSSSEPYTVEVTYEYHGSSNNYSSLTTVVIPETVTYNGTTYSVTSIGREAFANCSGLTSITIPNSVTSIGWYAFAHCSGLKSVTIPNSVMSIGDYAFRNCSGLTSVTIPNSVTSIGDGAFVACSSLTSIVVEDGNTIYDSRENCNAIIETASNTLIAGCQNTTIPNSVTRIGSQAFYFCSGLTSVTIPNSVTSIGDYAFYGTGIYNNEANWEAGVLYISNCLIEAKDLSGAYIIKDGTRLIADYAFEGCSGLTEIEIPNSVTSIGDYAFAYCTGLTSITIGNSVTSIRGGAFVACSGVSSIVVEDGNTVYDSRENCNAIIETASNTLIAGCQNTTIPNSVTSIGREAFADCSGLTSVTIPNSVTSIGDWAFAWCESLKEVICYAEEVPELGEDVFYKVPQSEATLYVPASALGDYQVAEHWKKFGTILPIQETENNLENTDSPYPITDTRKEIRNGQLIILRDGVEYNAMGQEL